MRPELYDTLDGQVTLVTGANRGIGRETARGLAALDATVSAGVRDLDYDVPDGTEPVQLDVNLRGPMLLTKHALPHLLDDEGGRVVNVSSGLGVLSEPIDGDHPAYRVSKAGLNGLTVSLDVSHTDEGLVANSVDPGWVATDLGGSQAPREPEKGAETPVWLARFAPGSPSGLFWKDREVIDY